MQEAGAERGRVGAQGGVGAVEGGLGAGGFWSVGLERRGGREGGGKVRGRGRGGGFPSLLRGVGRPLFGWLVGGCGGLV